MNPATARRFCVFGFLAAWITPLAAQKWQVQYFYDKAKSSFEIADLQFPSATRGIAVGVVRGDKRDEPTSVVTNDGGAHWETIALKEPPVSLFFLNDSQGWMVTTKGLWRTAESGRSWTKLPKPPGSVFRVYFLDENRGWAVGARKTALQTGDGGKSWKPLAVAKSTGKENLSNSAYTWIAFASPRFGLITGWNIPPLRMAPRLPEWVDPSSTLQQFDMPHETYTVTTSDSGATWKASAGTLFGTISRIRFVPGGKGLGLIQFGPSFRFPSEVYSITWPDGQPKTLYRDTKFAVTDIWLASDGTAYLAGTEVRGRLRNVVPAKVQVLTSKDWKDWKPIPVDYRAEARGVVLAAADDQHLWMATDSGMILSLVR